MGGNRRTKLGKIGWREKKSGENSFQMKKNLIKM